MKLDGKYLVLIGSSFLLATCAITSRPRLVYSPEMERHGLVSIWMPEEERLVPLVPCVRWSKRVNGIPAGKPIPLTTSERIAIMDRNGGVLADCYQHAEDYVWRRP